MSIRWRCHYLIHTADTSWETNPSKNRNGPLKINPLYKFNTSPKLMQQYNLTLIVIFPVPGCFPVYRLTMSQARKTNQKSLLLLLLYIKILAWIYPEMFVNKWTRVLSWHCHYLTPTTGISWETRTSVNKHKKT